MIILNYVFIIFTLVTKIKYINFNYIILTLHIILVNNRHRHQEIKNIIINL